MRKLMLLVAIFLGIGASAQEGEKKSKPEVKEYFIYDVNDKFLNLSDKTKEGTAKKLDSLGLRFYKLMKVYKDGTNVYCTYEGTKNQDFLKSI